MCWVQEHHLGAVRKQATQQQQLLLSEKPGLLLSTRDHLAAKCRSEIACGSLPPVLILSFHLVSYGLACGVPSLEELSRDVQKQVEVHCKYMWQQRSLMPWLPGKPSPRNLCDGDGERHEGRHSARGLPWVSTSPATATCRSAYWLSKQEVEDGAGTLAARRKVATENAGWRTKEMNARPDVTCGGMRAN